MKMDAAHELLSTSVQWNILILNPFMNNSSRASLKLITLSSIYCRGRCCSLFFVEVGERDVGCNTLSVAPHFILLSGVVSKKRRVGAVDVFGQCGIGYSFWCIGQRLVRREITLRWEVHSLQRGWSTSTIGRRRLGIHVQLSSKEREKGAGQLKEVGRGGYSTDTIFICSKKGTLEDGVEIEMIKH